MTAAQTPLLDAPATLQDWQARAFERLQAARPRLHRYTLAQALDDALLGRVVRAFANQLLADAQAQAELAARAQRYGRPVMHNGFGYVAVAAPRPPKGRTP